MKIIFKLRGALNTKFAASEASNHQDYLKLSQNYLESHKFSKVVVTFWLKLVLMSLDIGYESNDCRPEHETSALFSWLAKSKQTGKKYRGENILIKVMTMTRIAQPKPLLLVVLVLLIQFGYVVGNGDDNRDLRYVKQSLKPRRERRLQIRGERSTEQQARRQQQELEATIQSRKGKNAVRKRKRDGSDSKVRKTINRSELFA